MDYSKTGIRSNIRLLGHKYIGRENSAEVFNKVIIAKTEEPSEALMVISKLRDDYEKAVKETVKNPSKIVKMIAYLENGTEVTIERISNNACLTVEIDGIISVTGEKRKLYAGIASVILEVVVTDIGPQKPNLQIV